MAPLSDQVVVAVLRFAPTDNQRALALHCHEGRTFISRSVIGRACHQGLEAMFTVSRFGISPNLAWCLVTTNIIGLRLGVWPA